MKILADNRALRFLIYAVTALIGVGTISSGLSTPADVEAWLEKAPSIAATLTSILAMVNLTPRETTPELPNPTAEYARRLREE